MLACCHNHPLPDSLSWFHSPLAAARSSARKATAGAAAEPVFPLSFWAAIPPPVSSVYALLPAPPYSLGGNVVVNNPFADVAADDLNRQLLQVSGRYSSIVRFLGYLGYDWLTISEPSEPVVDRAARLQGGTTRSEEHAKV
jgi:hypothetical protein